VLLPSLINAFKFTTYEPYKIATFLGTLAKKCQCSIKCNSVRDSLDMEIRILRDVSWNVQMPMWKWRDGAHHDVYVERRTCWKMFMSFMPCSKEDIAKSTYAMGFTTGNLMELIAERG